MIRGLLTAAGLVLFAVAGFYLLQPPGPRIPWEHSLVRAQERAREEDEFLVAYLQTEWCTYCRQMERTTLRDSKLVEAIGQSYVWVKLDAEKDPEGMRLNQKFKAQGYPTILILDPDSGEEIDRLQGYVSASEMQKRIEELTTGQESFARILQTALREPQSAPAQFSLGEKYLERSEFQKAVRLFERVAQLDDGNEHGLNDTSIYYQAFALASAQEPDEALQRINELEKKFPESEVLPDAWVLRGQIHHYAGRNQQARQVFERYLKRFSAHPYAGGVRQLLSELDEKNTLTIDH